MSLKSFLPILFILLSIPIHAQNMENYTASWEGEIRDKLAFILKIEILNFGKSNATFKISNSNDQLEVPIIKSTLSFIDIQIGENLHFKGELSKNGKTINGFIKSGLLLYHLQLLKSKNNSFEGTWNVLMLQELKSNSFYLSVEDGLKEDYQAYPIFGDNRFTGTWCADFQKSNDQITFSDFKTGLQFMGKLLDNIIQLEIHLGDFTLAKIELEKSENDWKVEKFQSVNKSSELALLEMERLISTDSLLNTHSVLVSKNGKLIYEKYFDGYQAEIPHDMRSASKSISSAIVGIAKDQGLFENVNQSIFDFLPKTDPQFKDSLKVKIDIQSLLTMSSGLDAIDYGIGANSKSPATEDNYQRTNNWTETILNSQIIHPPNTHANYGSANPYLLGIALDSMVVEPLELFMDKNLFQKLGITNYLIQTDLKGKPYFGGGMYLTPKDMLKFGELYLNQGKWKNEQIISKTWLESSIKNYRVLENTVDKNGYGYFWWHHSYSVNGKNILTIEARGAGGQYIFIVPTLETVVVITSGNYRNGKNQQPELMLEKYILPSVLN